MKFILVLLTLFISCESKEVSNTTTQSPDFDGMLIAFGSCNNQNEAQPLWKDIKAENPDLWVWLGDNIYADTENMTEMKAMYDSQLANSGYSDFISGLDVVGTWDDHDYGINDGDKTYPRKAESKKLALDFLGVDEEAEVRKRTGLYQSYTYSHDSVDLRLILLDCRYFRDPITKGQDGYISDAAADILGEQQWNWLETELDKDEDVLIVVSGIQVIAEEHRYEKWANFPTSRQRLFDLLNQDEADKVILLSGDRHIGEMASINVGEKIIYEVTSSGLTHSYENVGHEANKHRIGQLTGSLNYGLMKISKSEKIQLLLKGKNRSEHMILDI